MEKEAKTEISESKKKISVSLLLLLGKKEVKQERKLRAFKKMS